MIIELGKLTEETKKFGTPADQDHVAKDEG